jgi:uncharacterized repeat protein (TIGR03847 family)
MAEDRVDFGRAHVLGAEAIGTPGNRRFRIYVTSRRGAASLWLERETLDLLGQRLEEMTERQIGGLALRVEAVAQPAEARGAPPDFPADPEIDFIVGNMKLAIDEERERVLLLAAPLAIIDSDDEDDYNAPDDGHYPFRVFFSNAQTRQLIQDIWSVLAAGRPRCPFCERPMEHDHLCAKQDGFRPASLN